MKRILFSVFLLYITLLCGEDLLIGSIEFSGNQKFSSQVLSSHIQSRVGDIVNHEQLNEDRLRLLSFYQLENMGLTTISYPEKVPTAENRLKVVFNISEKSTPFIEDISIEGNNYLSIQKIKQLIYFKPNEYSITEIDKIQYKILEIYLDRAFLFCEVDFDSILLKDSLLTASFKVHEQQQVTFSNAIIRGNKTSKVSSIIKISNLKKDKLLTPNQIKKAQDNLNSKDYIKQSYVTPLNGNTVLIDIEEAKSTYLEGVFSFNRNESKSLLGYLNFHFLNLLGSDRNLDFHWQSDQYNKYLKMKYLDPGPSSIPLAFNISFEREEADSSYIKTLSELELYTYFNAHKLGLITSLNTINPGSRQLNRYEKNSQENIGAFWSFSTLNYPRNPTNGMYIYYKHILNFSKIHNNKTSRQADEFTASFANSLRQNLVMYNSINAKTIQNKSLEQYDLYTAGGTFSIRGFPEKFFMGNQVFWMNNEIRLLTNRDSRFFIFTDFGYIKDERPSINKTFNEILGYGIGLRMLTRVGILHIDYGLNYYQKNWTNPLDGYIHLGIETSF
ncbi:MAG TPA: POTRA domain-containing protein [Candidatus Cloacimonadota bacterium]|nr:POTRA domain-containing protein [Candidatus Cloacimonadota bacterium]HQB40415.1 POTRA domain-containing protein [Candidatus Cloacimonadota bacterium]